MSVKHWSIIKKRGYNECGTNLEHVFIFRNSTKQKQRGKGLNYCQYELADIIYNIYIVIFLQIYVHL